MIQAAQISTQKRTNEHKIEGFLTAETLSLEGYSYLVEQQAKVRLK